jgi:hypothetical protein
MANKFHQDNNASKSVKPKAAAKKTTPKKKVPATKPANVDHPGFKSVAADISRKEGISKQEASAILANASRKASPAAKTKNPKLNKVK